MREHIGKSTHEHAHLAVKRADTAKRLWRLASVLGEPETCFFPAQECHRRERREPG
jgi:hypothetical protein